jgi:hypothetical protein
MPGNKHMTKITNLINPVFALFAFASFALSPNAQALVPGPDGCYPNLTTAEGCNSLQNLTTGAGNTGVGWRSLFSNSFGSFNTAIGAGALILNNGDNNTAVGTGALLLNIAGIGNTAVGDLALQNNTGDFNIALGAEAGTDPNIGSNNIYIGDAGFGGDENTISIGGISVTGTDYQNAYIGGIYGHSVNVDTALLVYVDTDGHLGTGLVDASGQKMRMRSPQDAQSQPKLNEFQKHQKRIAELESMVARLAATVKEQATQIQKVSAQLAAANGAAAMGSDIHGSNREGDTSGNKEVDLSLADVR